MALKVQQMNVSNQDVAVQSVLVEFDRISKTLSLKLWAMIRPDIELSNKAQRCSEVIMGCGDLPASRGVDAFFIAGSVHYSHNAVFREFTQVKC